MTTETRPHTVSIVFYRWLYQNVSRDHIHEECLGWMNNWAVYTMIRIKKNGLYQVTYTEIGDVGQWKKCYLGLKQVHLQYRCI